MISSLLFFFLAADSGLPEGKGKDVVENVCTECHTVERIKTQRHDEEGWTAIVREMIENGAAINSGDIKIIIDYLTKNFGPEKSKQGPERTQASGRPLSEQIRHNLALPAHTR